MKPLEPILKMPQRPQELRCCKELLVSKVPCSSAWVGGTRERGYPPLTSGVHRRVKSQVPDYLPRTTGAKSL